MALRLYGRQWNKNESLPRYEAITAAYIRGEKLRVIAAQFGITPKWAKRIAKRMGATMRKNGRPRDE